MFSKAVAVLFCSFQGQNGDGCSPRSRRSPAPLVHSLQLVMFLSRGYLLNCLLLCYYKRTRQELVAGFAYEYLRLGNIFREVLPSGAMLLHENLRFTYILCFKETIQLSQGLNLKPYKCT